MPRKKRSKTPIADPGVLTTATPLDISASSTSFKSGAIYLHTPTDTVEEPRAFTPGDVSWEDLRTLYQDDPLLAAVFEQMKDWCKSDDDFWSPRTQWTLNDPRAVSGTKSYLGSTTSKISDSFTLHYDTNGTYKLTTDLKPAPSTTVTFDTDE